MINPVSLSPEDSSIHHVRLEHLIFYQRNIFHSMSAHPLWLRLDGRAGSTTLCCPKNLFNSDAEPIKALDVQLGNATSPRARNSSGNKLA
jgi:hypothetical protein